MQVGSAYLEFYDRYAALREPYTIAPKISINRLYHKKHNTPV